MHSSSSPCHPCAAMPVVIAALLAAPAFAQTFTILAPLPQYATAQGLDLSSDASVLVGFCRGDPNFNQRAAFRSVTPHGVSSATLLPSLAPDPIASALAVSGDGAVAVGFSGDLATLNTRAVRWVNGNPQLLGALPGDSRAFANAASFDGSFVVGTSQGSTDRAFRWSDPAMGGSGLVPIATPQGSTPGSAATGVSADGSTIVGSNNFAAGRRAFRWTAGGGMQPLGLLPDTLTSDAQALSADASTIIGVSSSASNDLAFRWKSANGGTMLPLGVLPTSTSTSPIDLSADGASIVGVYFLPSTGLQYAFLWTSARGIVSLTEHLASLGVNLDGWTLEAARAISADGLTIAGTARRQGEQRAFIATLAASACPSDLDNDGNFANGNSPDGAVTIDDLLYFLVAFEVGSATADLDNDGDPTWGTPDGAVTIDDLLFFVVRFEQGC